MDKNIINRDDCSIVIEGIGRRAYVNSARERSYLIRDLSGKNDSLLTQVIETWGNIPTVEDSDLIE